LKKQITAVAKHLQEKTNENEIIKKSLKEQNNDISKLRDDVNKNTKAMKLKEKEIYDLGKKNENNETTNKKNKEEIYKLKKENKELLKESRRKKKPLEAVTTSTSYPHPSSTLLTSMSPTFLKPSMNNSLIMNSIVSSTTAISPPVLPPTLHQLLRLLPPYVRTKTIETYK
jgi:hypothetical protein